MAKFHSVFQKWPLADISSIWSLSTRMAWQHVLSNKKKIHSTEQFIIDWDLRCPHQATSFKIRILPPETSAPETREKIPSLRIEKKAPTEKSRYRYEFGAPWRWTNDLVVFTFWCRFPNTLKLFGLSLFLSLSFAVLFTDHALVIS